MAKDLKAAIDSCYDHVKQAYNRLEELGCTMPSSKNIENLRATIRTYNPGPTTGAIILTHIAGSGIATLRNCWNVPIRIYARGKYDTIQAYSSSSTNHYRSFTFSESTIGEKLFVLADKNELTGFVNSPIVNREPSKSTVEFSLNVPSLDPFLNEDGSAPNSFFSGFCKDYVGVGASSSPGAITHIEDGCFDTSNITKVGKNYFYAFNAGGSLTSLPAGSFRISPNLTTVGVGFFGFFNTFGALTSLPIGSFDTSRIKTTEGNFFTNFNWNKGALTRGNGGVKIYAVTEITSFDVDDQNRIAQGQYGYINAT